jgi:hypothetical protein
VVFPEFAHVRVTDMADLIDTILDTPEDVAEVREFFGSLPVGEQRRLAEWFISLMESKVIPDTRDWRDRTPDGNRKAPPPLPNDNEGPLDPKEKKKAIAAKNGK